MSENEILAEKKKAIFESTLELVRENGFHGTPMSLVAKKAGVAAGTIYHYFESKDALLIALYGYLRSQMFGEIMSDNDESQDFETRFFTFWKKYYHFYVQHPNVLYFVEQFVNSPYYDRCPEKDYDRCQNVIANFLKPGIESGLLKNMDLKLLTILVHSSILTSAKVHLGNRTKITETEEKQVARYVWDGIRNHRTFKE